MEPLRKVWAVISHALTLQSLLLLLFPTGILIGLAIWLSSLTTFVRVFAPLSYLLVALLTLILTCIVTYSVVSVAKQLGWNPIRRSLRPKLPPRDAHLADVVMYVARESAYGVVNIASNTPMAVIQNELMDRICEERLVVWGRVGTLPVDRIRANDLQYSQISAANGTITRQGEWGATVFTDIQMNWRQIRRTWPKPTAWRRAVSRWRNRDGPQI